MIICKECGSIMMPKKEGSKTIFTCRNGHRQEGSAKKTETVDSKSHEIAVIENKIETLPVVKIKCPECGHDEASNWEIQTRSPDEAATQFFKCKKCGYTWREYR